MQWYIKWLDTKRLTLNLQTCLRLFEIGDVFLVLDMLLAI